jgi:hypothetical protein
LFNAGSSWRAAGEAGNEVPGRFFGANHAVATMTDRQGCLFLPAGGYRSDSDGALYGRDSGAIMFRGWMSPATHWLSGLQGDADSSVFLEAIVNPVVSNLRACGFSLLCVKGTKNPFVFVGVKCLSGGYHRVCIVPSLQSPDFGGEYNPYIVEVSGTDVYFISTDYYGNLLNLGGIAYRLYYEDIYGSISYIDLPALEPDLVIEFV